MFQFAESIKCEEEDEDDAVTDDVLEEEGEGIGDVQVYFIVPSTPFYSIKIEKPVTKNALDM